MTPLLRHTTTAITLTLVFASFTHTSTCAPQQFATPADAAKALVQAVESDTTDSLVSVFGENAKELITSGDPVQDKNDLERFRDRVKELTAISKASETTATLIIGSEAWPFPIPLVKSGEQWNFDVAAGREAILDRRIGENELNAIKACRAYVGAQYEFASQDHDDDGVMEYAQRIISSPGKKDGLYWPAGDGEEESPLGEIFAAAAAEGYSIPEGAESETPRPEGFHGYRYGILTGQGENVPGGAYSYIQNGNMVTDFALVASPVKYEETGVMTFLVNSRGEIYQKALGPDAPKIDSYNPDDSWEPVE